MLPTAISQVIEQVVRIVLGVFLCWYCVVMLQKRQPWRWRRLPWNHHQQSGGLPAFKSSGIFYFTRKHKTLLLKTSRKTPLSRKRILKRLVLIAVSGYPDLCHDYLFLLCRRHDVCRPAGAGRVRFLHSHSPHGGLLLCRYLCQHPFKHQRPPSRRCHDPRHLGILLALKDQAGINERINNRYPGWLCWWPCPAVSAFLCSRDGIFTLILPGSEHGAAIMEVYAFATIFIMLSNTFQSILQSIDRFIIPLIALLGASVVRIGCSYVFNGYPRAQYLRGCP